MTLSLDLAMQLFKIVNAFKLKQKLHDLKLRSMYLALKDSNLYCNNSLSK